MKSTIKPVFSRIALLLVFVLFFMNILIVPSGCKNASTVQNRPVHVEGAIFGGQNDDSIALELKFDPQWLTRGDNKTYQADLARFSVLLSADSYFREKDLEKARQNRVLIDGEDAAAYDWTTLLKKLGFTEAVHIETFKEKEYPCDSNDSATMNLGYSTFDNKDVYVIVLRGCFSAQEWVSVFDPGAETGYTDWTGEHPEWKHHAHMKGTDVAFNRAMEFINSFIDSNDNPGRENCILVTGHSRGGIIAAMVGAELESRERTKSFTYTFNTMPMTADPSASDYQTIFNLFDSQDFYIDPLPFGEEPFYYYGKTLSLDLSQNAALSDALSDLKGRTDPAVLTHEEKEEYAALFASCFPNRASLYETNTQIETFSSKADAQARVDELAALIGSDGLALGTLCRVTDLTESEDQFSVTLEYCPAALLVGYSRILAYGSAASEAFMDVFSDDSACAIAEFLTDHAAAISGGHLLVNSYLLAGEVKP